MNKWINVEDKLPECNQTCLVYSKEYGIEIDTFKEIDHDGDWPYPKTPWFVDGPEITHWMELPNRPSLSGIKCLDKEGKDITHLFDFDGEKITYNGSEPIQVKIEGIRCPQ